MKTFVIGDIHGGLKALVQLLNKIEIKQGDKLIFLGDYVDGWSESAQLVQFLIELSETFNCVFIKGNHDVWCEAWLKNNYVDPIWYMHGGKETIQSYENVSTDDKLRHFEFFHSMSLYHIDVNNRLFLHAGFTSMHGVEKEVSAVTFYYDRTLWEMALALDKDMEETSELYPNRLKHYNEIFIGHTPTINYNCYEPMNAANVWNIDTGAAFFGPLSGMNVETKEIFQSNVVRTFYPDETGRNKS
ncbi:metallophosphoesterase family protein [Gaetbulibacter saemankumensis]|uniref:metallophosphoesterase family protein n=1 Tax=Gaetbulibacter saemankumensis TaxID=311208 RepID=UPI00041AEB1F|nr:metallophosphoesterase family protein [Gaetbulibacter saemankumensis]